LCPPVLANETELIAVAKHFMNPQWMANDWYLGQPIEYRFVVNGIAGFFVNALPVWYGTIVTRAILYIGYSYAILRLGRVLSINIPLLLVAVLVFSSNQSLLADESLITGIEAKAFSYVFVLLAVSMLLEEKHRWMWMFLGAALSCHVLVGGYALGTTVGYLAVTSWGPKAGARLRQAVKGIWLLPVAGVVGFLAIVSYGAGAASVDSSLAARIYTWRNWHHLHLLFRTTGFSEVNAFKILSAVGTVFLAWWIVPKSADYRQSKSLLLYGAIASLWLLVGATASVARMYDLLKYYLFRFPDVMVPFVLVFGAAAAGSELFRRYRQHGVANGLRGLSTVAIVGAVLLATVGSFDSVSSLIHRMVPHPRGGVPIADKAEREFYEWISTETEEGDLFLMPPFGNEDFFLKAQRPQFFSFGAMSSTDPEIIEWYRRLTYVNGGTPPDLEVIHTVLQPQYESNYLSLSQDRLSVVADRWGLDFYVTTESRPDLIDKLAFENDDYYVYEL